MKNQELFNRTINILVKAYFDGYLEATDCAACAIGNIVSANLGYERIELNMFKDKNGIRIPALWDEVVWHIRGDNGMNPENEEAIKQVKSTGYSGHELNEIEMAFLQDKKWPSKIDNFDRLMEVVDCLMKIHEANEVEIKEAKELFVKA